MDKGKSYQKITKPILVFCIILILFILVSCSKKSNEVNLNVNKTTVSEKTLSDKSSFNFSKGSKETKGTNKREEAINSNDFETFETIEYEETQNKNILRDLSNIKNTYYGKYDFDGEDVLGNFEVTRNSIVFTPDNGYSKEVIHFSGIRNIDRVEYPNGKVDLHLQYDGYEKVIRNVSDEMFSDVLLYTTK